jgi:Tfp pilus assembly protein PilP
METMTMLGKTYTAIILALALVAGTATLTAASTSISQIDLSRDGSFTVLTIHGNGQLRYAHQSVEATGNKPFRVVVDCLAARHNLPRFQFTDLPPSIVTAVRTSQYSVTPEEVVRVVLDLAQESVYRVEAAGDVIKVYVSDQKTAPFPVWTSGAVSTPPSTESKPEPSVAVEKPARKPTVVAKTEQLGNKSTTKTTSPQVAKLPAPDNQAAKKPVPAQQLANDTIERAKAFAQVQSEPETKKVPTAVQKTKTEKAIPETSHKSTKDSPSSPAKKSPASVTPTSKATPTAPSPVVEGQDKELADAGSSAKKEKVDISRYRRATAKEAELKASKVVEFPKRMVIKYKKTNPRDPFEALIAPDDKSKNHVIDLNKAPNAEALQLVGILESVVGKDAALLQDRDGIGYILRAGDRVQNGYVAQIDENAVYFQINEYGWSRTLVKHMEKSK